MSGNTGYYIPSGYGNGEYEEKRSRFISYLDTVESEEEAKAFIADIKKKNYDARHNCWCYIIKDGPERYSDDGEPQGTAGMPMLEVLRHENLTNTVCVVTRYFGGVLLGTGGLVRAYTKATKEALQNAGISVVRKWIECSIECPYPIYDRLRSEIDIAKGIAKDIDYGKDVALTLLIPEESYEAFKRAVSDISSGNIETVLLNDTYRAVPVK